MYIEKLQEIVCQAHMSGQHNQSGVDPSWSEAFSYWKNEVEPKLTSKNSDSAKCPYCNGITTNIDKETGMSLGCDDCHKNCDATIHDMY